MTEELQISCLNFILNCREHFTFESLAPVIIIALECGRNHLSLAELAIETLESWITKNSLKSISKYADVFVKLILTYFEGENEDNYKESKGISKNTLRRRLRKVGSSFSFDQVEPKKLKDLKMKMYLFLGSLGGYLNIGFTDEEERIA